MKNSNLKFAKKMETRYRISKLFSCTVIILIFISLLSLKAHATGSLSETVITKEKVTISGTVKDVLWSCECYAAPQSQKKLTEFIKSFEGKKSDFLQYVLAGGYYGIGDDPEYEWSGLINNALLILAYDPDAPAWKDNPVEEFASGTASESFYNQIFWNIRHNRIPEDANRVWSEVLDAYLLLKHLFTIKEQIEIERWMCEKAKTYAEAKKRRWGHQYVPQAFAALTAYVLKHTDTGEDFSEDIEWLESFAREKAHNFSHTFGPVENASSYIFYVLQSMFSLSLYLEGDGERFPDEHKPNLRKAVKWILEVYPQNGFSVTYGTEWGGRGNSKLVDFLYAAAWALKDGDENDRKLASEAKWFAIKMFRFCLNLSPLPFKAPVILEWTPHDIIRSVKSKHGVYNNPIWLLRYADDSLKPLRPDPSAYSSKVVYGEYGNTYWGPRLELKPSKVVHRSGYDDDALYILLDIAPKCGKSMPYANAICDISFGEETFTPGHKLEQGNAGNQKRWDERITVEPHDGDKWDAEIVWFKNYKDYSASRTDEGKWKRIISFIKDNPYSVIFDFAPDEGVAHWQFISRPKQKRLKESIELYRGNRKLRVYWGNDDWYNIESWDDSRIPTIDPKDNVWVMDEPARRLKINSAGTWALALVPVKSDMPKSVETIDPKREDKHQYPEAVGMKMVFQEHTDWHGAQKGSEMLDYGEMISTDYELFFARCKNNRWSVYFINGWKIVIKTSKPKRILLNGKPIQQHREWMYEDGKLIISPTANEGVLSW